MNLITRARLQLPSWLLESAPILGEQGFNERADVVQAADGTDLNEFWNELITTINLRNQKRNQMIGLLARYVSEPTLQIAVPGEVDFEEASEFGQPKGIRISGTRFWRGFDFRFYDLAIRYTWMFIAEADQAQLRMLHAQALDADNKLIYNKVMKCLFNPTNTLGVTDQNEPIVAYKFYNADGEVPPTYKTNTFAGSHTHYSGSNAGTVVSEDLDAMEVELGHHGYTLGNGYRLVLWANPAQVNVIKTFKTSTGDSFDFIPDPNFLGGGVWMPNDGTYVGAPTGSVPGRVGTYGPWHIVQEDYIPAGYLVGLASGGPENLQNPIGIREHKNPAYRGLKVIPGQRSQYPLLDSFYRRGLGTGITQRGGGVVRQIVASTSYTVPTQYA